jgi:hypothetical protein
MGTWQILTLSPKMPINQQHRYQYKQIYRHVYEIFSTPPCLQWTEVEIVQESWKWMHNADVQEQTEVSQYTQNDMILPLINSCKIVYADHSLQIYIWWFLKE